jgi:DNA repair exonuclease SbcCD ATPase subunit
LTDQARANEALIQKLSQDLQTLQATVTSLDNQIWARQSALAKNLTEVQNDLLPVLTGQVESLSHGFQAAREKLDEIERLRLQLDKLEGTLARDQKERMGNETFASFARQGMAVHLERAQTQLAELQTAVASLTAKLDQAQVEQRQASSAEAAWLGALAGQLEQYRQSLSGKRSTPRTSSPPAP